MSNEYNAGSSVPETAAVRPGRPLPRLTPFQAWLAAPVSGASLAVFRFCVGIVMALEAYTLCVPSASTFNQVPLETFYTGADIKFRVPYSAFEWLPMLPPFWIHVIVGVLAVGGVCMAIGLFHRFAAAAVFFSWGYLYAVESTRTYWMSYYYLELLVTFLLIWMPASRRYSVDAWLNRNKGLPDTVPFWTLVLLRAQLVVTYFYAGLAKVSADWLIDGEPVRYFLSKARVIEELGPKLSESQAQLMGRILHSEVLVYVISWVGAGFDLAIGFLLLVRRTRILGIVLVLIFHGTNHFIIFKDIHWFPLVGITTALIFLDADWPERAWRWIRDPKFAAPDWKYFIGGGIALPGVGTALGWSLAPTATTAVPMSARRLGSWVTPFVVLWLGWQTLNPLRQFLVPVDSRFTWEGLSFCWRLKAEVYRCNPSKVFIGDPYVIAANAAGRTQITWTQWRGEKELFRQVNPAKIDWSQLPELLVTLEPRIGERMIYNPYSASNVARTEKESQARIGEIWRGRYGRLPQGIRRMAPIRQIAGAYAASLQSHGVVVKDLEEAMMLLNKRLKEDGQSEMLGVLRRLNPFGIEGATATDQPFYLIEDEALLPTTGATNAVAHLPRVDRTAWKTGIDTQGPEGARQVNVGGDPLIVFTTETLFEEGQQLPGSFIVDAQDDPGLAARIQRNYVTDLALGTWMHVSMQPFLLRRYCRHVADLWQKEYGRRPAVHAATAVSLNGRPAQMLVDPEADLARVPVALFGHNAWIRDLEVARVPQGGIPR